MPRTNEISKARANEIRNVAYTMSHLDRGMQASEVSLGADSNASLPSVELRIRLAVARFRACTVMHEWLGELPRRSY